MGRSRECELLVIGVPPLVSVIASTSPNVAPTHSPSSALASTSPAAAPTHSPSSAIASSSPADTPSTALASTSPNVAPTHSPSAATAESAASISARSCLPPTAVPTHSPYSAPEDSTLPHPYLANQPPLTPTPAELVERWGLSLAQSDAAATALQFLNTPYHLRESHSFLLWAVTGAGKTEMIFPLLEAVLSRGGRALVATPRRDVVLELAPRLAKAFPNYERTVLYGGSTDRWENGALTLATTHQLLRFQEAFDLVLIDELDAFPYHNDPMLHHGADKCRKKTGSTVFLSATPPQHMQRLVSRRRLPCARVPVRYHRHPLPVPSRLVIPTIAQLLRKQALPKKLVQPLRQSIQREAQIFLFVPYVKQVEPTVKLLQQHANFLNIDPHSIAGTSSKDAQRTEKVVSFREQTIKLLVTTTILERGVTIPKSDVFILDAHNALFDAASLVQMAGRAGRSAVDPFGYVFFGAPSLTFSQQDSIRQIRSMNTLARKQGYLQ